ncbi:NifU-like protein 4 [Durusdinium trenchii]|uniref:Mitochondrial (AtNfu-III) (AtNfu4) n=1 Tax=Durusdinium trenchii TaxID=1381693 RepID=A0ABP0M272_9DINO
MAHGQDKTQPRPAEAGALLAFSCGLGENGWPTAPDCAARPWFALALRGLPSGMVNNQDQPRCTHRSTEALGKITPGRGTRKAFRAIVLVALRPAPSGKSENAARCNLARTPRASGGKTATATGRTRARTLRREQERERDQKREKMAARLRTAALVRRCGAGLVGRENLTARVAGRRWISSFELLREVSPNPSAQRFVASDGKLQFLRPSAGRASVEVKHLGAAGEELPESARKLAAPKMVEGLRNWDVVNLFVTDTFVSVTLSEDAAESADWDAIEEALQGALEEDLGEDKWKAVFAEEATASQSGPVNEDPELAELDALIEDVLDQRVRPTLHQDGGDIEYRGFDPETGIVKLRLSGACVSCPSSTATLRFGVKNLLTHLLDEVTDVVQVYDDGDLSGTAERSADWTG